MVSISCSKGEKHQHTGVVFDDGTVYMWGDPYKGQLGQYTPKESGWDHKEDRLFSTPILIWNDPAQKVKKLVCGGIHTAFLTEQGRLFTFGCGSDGRLGHPEYVGHTYLYKESRPKLVESLSVVHDVDSSYYHMLAISE